MDALKTSAFGMVGSLLAAVCMLLVISLAGCTTPWPNGVALHNWAKHTTICDERRGSKTRCS